MKQMIFFLLICLTSIACNRPEPGENIAIPDVTRQFINKSFSNFTIKKGAVEILCDGTEAIEVEIENEKGEEMELIFHPPNNLLHTEYDMHRDDLPALVKSKIITDYTNFNIREVERLDFLNDDVQFEAELKDGFKELEVRFTANGKVICEKDD